MQNSRLVVRTHSHIISLAAPRVFLVSFHPAVVSPHAEAHLMNRVPIRHMSPRGPPWSIPITYGHSVTGGLPRHTHSLGNIHMTVFDIYSSYFLLLVISSFNILRII